jgi:phosphohistidine phosphatase
LIAVTLHPSLFTFTLRAMDLILWRHADAEEGYPDLARNLTAKGHKQAEAVAKWLRSRLPKNTVMRCSPATRTKQTMEALTDRYEIVSDIAPGADRAAVLKAAGWPDAHGAVLIVGHQPTLGETVGWLLCDNAGALPINKGAVWWLAQRESDGPIILRAVISPDLV